MDAVYGIPEADQATGVIIKTGTLFPSPKGSAPTITPKISAHIHTHTLTDAYTPDSYHTAQVSQINTMASACVGSVCLT